MHNKSINAAFYCLQENAELRLQLDVCGRREAQLRLQLEGRNRELEEIRQQLVDRDREVEHAAEERRRLQQELTAAQAALERYH